MKRVIVFTIAVIDTYLEIIAWKYHNCSSKEFIGIWQATQSWVKIYRASQDENHCFYSF